jgi:ribonuclease E
MPNRWRGRWGSHLTAKLPKPKPSRFEGVLNMRDIHGPLKIRVRHETHGDETDADTPNVEPPKIHLIRRPPGGGTITYDGKMVVEGTFSQATGTYVITGVSLGTIDESGDWTANRPPPKPGGQRAKAGAKKAPAGKKASTSKKGAAKKSAAKKSPAKKAAKSQKSASKKKSSATAKTSRSDKAAKKR